MASFHEAGNYLSRKTRDLHRALLSLQQELQAIDWYCQRLDACHDAQPRNILLHNMREEMEHSAITEQEEMLTTDPASADESRSLTLSYPAQPERTKPAAGCAPPRPQARWPLFAADRIRVLSRSALKKLAVHNSPLVRIASGHRPLIAELTAVAGKHIGHPVSTATSRNTGAHV